ncbi:mechanosensitive ion channel [Sphingomonas sp. AOB5]|uniref:mechanosensitive ion channel family protein n=1 Tax=Sphingomonas sp. AOB5 TaxID=3034017 RepID=UPI0023F79D09|nr:mechanosensitive ion channel domain-containing protein [Sphingomonas sp. AOB5]MDF7775164.1 mechanosensitive ion channel [Sphingomonas sp. AOB5]
MNGIGQWLAAQGIAIPSNADLAEAGIALALALIALAAGWWAGRTLGDWLTRLWTERIGVQEDGVGTRLHAICRHGTAAILLAIMAVAWPWHPLAKLGFGFALGSAVAMLAVAVLRGLHLPRWSAWTMAGIAFTAIISRALGGLAAIRTTLDRVGLEVGSTRFSLLTVLTVLITIVLLFAAVRLINRLVGHAILHSKGFDPTQRLLAQKLAAIAVVILAFFVGIDVLGIDLTAFALFSGAFGLAIGFGLQKTIGNLIAGIILLMDRSIKPGDVIVVGDSFGWVNRIGVRAVSVITRDGKEHLIPNENLMTQEVENWSYTDRNVRVRIPVRVAYDCDLKLAQELMMRAAVESPRVLDNPKPNVWLTAFGDNGVEHEILAWISDPESGVGNVKSDVLNRLWLLFKVEGIEIPFPQRVVTMKAPEGGKRR